MQPKSSGRVLTKNVKGDRIALIVRPGLSRWLLGFWSLAHLGAILVILVLPIPGFHRLWLLACVVGYAGWIAVIHIWRRAPWSIMEAIRTREGWELVLATGEPVRARLLHSSFIGQRLMVLEFAVGRWRRLSLPLASDSLDGELMRRLRADLRMGSEKD